MQIRVKSVLRSWNYLFLAQALQFFSSFFGSGSVASSKPISDFLTDIENLKCQLEKDIKDLKDREESSLIRKLMELQYKLLIKVYQSKKS